MIAKHIAINSVRKSSYEGLVRYILDPQNKQERIGVIRCVNCYSDEPDFAMAEVLNIQQMNRRATSDKTYHLVISFRDDELSEDILRKVEDDLCAGLGFGEHQRISVVHKDTDNLHIHVAINKIHPVKLTIHNPYCDYKAIGDICTKIEQQYGLIADNHEPRKRGAQTRESDIAFKAGSESLVGWIQQECLDKLLSASSWDELHRVLADYHLELKVRGNGFVFVSDNGIGVKASAVDRSLSKGHLTQKLGHYADARLQEKGPSSECYEKRPLRSKLDTTQLYEQYKNEQAESAINRKNDWIRLSAIKDNTIQSALRDSKLRLFVIKNLKAGRFSKKMMYAASNRRLKKQLESIRRDYKKAYQSSKEKHQRMDWLSWLVKESKQGNREALAVLQARHENGRVNAVYGVQAGEPGIHTEAIETVTKSGTIIFNSGAALIREKGNQLVVLAGTSTKRLREILEAAVQQFGKTLSLNGTDAFCRKIVQVVAGDGMDITFTDDKLEQYRKELSNNTARQHDAGAIKQTTRGGNRSTRKGITR